MNAVTEEEPMLRVDDVHVAYGHVVAVRGLSLEVGKGAVLGILGPNGAGKSTLLKCITGAVRASQGSVRFAGKDVSRMLPERRAALGMAMSPEGRGVLGTLTVRENLMLGATAAKRVSRGVAEERLDQATEVFPILRDRLGERAGNLSGGQAAMLSVARAMMAAPQLLILDEPSLGLSPATTKLLFQSLHRLKGQKVTMLVVEQRAAQLIRLADQILTVTRGTATSPARDAKSVDMDEVTGQYLGGSEPVP